VYNTPLMPVKVRWILASLLCLCTLVALWVTGARVKAQKMAARYGDRTSASAPVIDPAATSRTTLRRGARVPAGHFSLELAEGGTVRVLDASGATLVEYGDVVAGDVRRWQELQLTFAGGGPDGMTAEVEFKPGSPCLGSGRYRALRQGLQIQFLGGRSITIAAWDAAKSEATLDLAGPSGAMSTSLALRGKGEAFKIRFTFDRDAVGPVLELRDLD